MVDSTRGKSRHHFTEIPTPLVGIPDSTWGLLSGIPTAFIVGSVGISDSTGRDGQRPLITPMTTRTLLAALDS